MIRPELQIAIGRAVDTARGLALSVALYHVSRGYAGLDIEQIIAVGAILNGFGFGWMVQ